MAAIVAARVTRATWIWIMLTGATIGGGILAQMYVKQGGARTAMTFAFTLMLLIVYGGIAFVGCLVVMSQMKF